jgi:tRNA nucleotidyltransferase (CCA-adding enzyme)
MKVILTHEQADMDALSSQLGAWLLYPDAIPLLPRSINRNGRRFISQYGADLPYVSFKDLPRDTVDTIILVDTQSLITIKGMGEHTRIVVYDHHPRREDLNPEWETHLVDNGSNTSQLVARIREQGVELTPIQATTLALGLYEDTGSFTYGSTTAEDLLAAGFCLAQGADMDIVTRFLYPPLSPGQRKLYDRLMRNVETYIIENQTILAAKADALDVKDEISSVAHKMRDVLNPDALLLLVATQQGVRLVARSTSDQVNVSTIAESMGGGGHKRAASALVRPEGSLDRDATLRFLDEQFSKMVGDLERHISPAVTVGTIMSKDPLILSPDTPVDEARRLMQRYGYEGFPVVENGHVVGLLNRREVDRAINHGLDLTVKSLMAAGEVKITPDASLDSLQTLMGKTDWGQVPVVSQHTGEIIGIVTRTDLLKTLSPMPDMPTQEEVAEKLSEVVPPARLALLHALAEEADKINLPVFVVGGFVRDLLLDRPSLDFDIVVEGDAIFFANRLSDGYGGRVLTHRRFGTAKWVIHDIAAKLIGKLPLSEEQAAVDLPESLDLITARTEFYEQPAALPTVESSSIKMDLHRRDFTINTLALRLDGEHYGKIHDYWGGLSDLHKGRIRVLHALSFVDDATRLLRAVRFEQRFDFQIEPRTLALMEESLPLLNKLTGARIRHEITLILVEPKAPDMLRRLAELGILHAIHPALPWDDEIGSRLHQLDHLEIDPVWTLPERLGSLSRKQTLGYLVWLGHLRETTLRSIVSRLRCKSELRILLVAASKVVHSLPDLVNAPVSAVVRELEKVPRAALYAAYLITPDDHLRDLLYKYAAYWAAIEPETTGDDLRAMGLKPSPAFGRILTALRDAWLDGKVENPEQEQAMLADLLAAETSADPDA